MQVNHGTRFSFEIYVKLSDMEKGALSRLQMDKFDEDPTVQTIRNLPNATLLSSINKSIFD